ncbi:MAG: peptide chain release factor N(5)-glutamine methyltransferase [Candidatus Sumerlaeia bacterium]|nr:peptide chain release factor N(5)-glutamine methyltransferase [Candidatus Sumerlaeia bacterium]
MARASASALLAESSRFLAARGVANARFEAELLLAHVLSVPRAAFYSGREQSLKPQQESVFWKLVKRRGAGEPVAYLTGEKEFYSLPFEINRSVLVPRPETEWVVDAALEVLREKGKSSANTTFFDVGTGSGVIAVALLVNLAGCRGWASDVSAPALELARRNAKRHGVDDRLTFLRADLFGDSDAVVDVVVSNPPYVAESERAELSASVLNYEPHEALFGGPDGLDVIRRLIAHAPRHLKSGGTLVFEIGYGKAPAVRQILVADGRWGEIDIRNDLAGIPRVVIARRKS